MNLCTECKLTPVCLCACMYVSVCCLSVVCRPVSPAAVCAQPENLLYASSDPKSPDYNTIKVADFGLSKFVSENSQMKTTCGTVRDGERGLVF